MSSGVGWGVVAWALLGAAGVVGLMVWRWSVARAETVVRACHELRGALGCVRLGLESGLRAGGLPVERVRVLELELRAASAALDDLGVRRGRGGGAVVRKVERVELSALVADAVAAWEPRAAAGGAVLEMRWLADHVYVWCDGVRLAQAVGNLIANAVEHGGGRVGVVGLVSAGRVRVEVIDCGGGLPAPVAKLARRAARGRGERGRGLAIAMAIVEAHGGRLAAAPSRRGARLVMTLPTAGGPGLRMRA